jgi:hypothetical protein
MVQADSGTWLAGAVAVRLYHLIDVIEHVQHAIDVLTSQKRNLRFTRRRFFTRAVKHSPQPTEVNTARSAGLSANAG